jgi:hypothetical protein
MPRGICRVTRLLLFVLGCSAFLLIAGPARAEDAPGAISQSVQRVTDAAGDGAREASGGAGDSDARDDSAGRPDGGEYSGSQDAGSNATDRGGDSGSNQPDSAADHSARFADDVSSRVDQATDASSHVGEGVAVASGQTESPTHEPSHQIEGETHEISDSDGNAVASSRDHAGHDSFRADDATRQVEEAPDATHEAPSRVVASVPRPEHRDEGTSAGSSDAGAGTGLENEAVLVNPRGGEVLTQATANATGALSEGAAIATEAVTERAGTVTEIGDGVTERLDAARTRADSTLVQHIESLGATATEAIGSAAQDGESLAKRLGTTVGGTIQNSLPERLELTRDYVAAALTAAASTLQVGSDAAQGAGTLFESTGTEASVKNPPHAVGEDLADVTGSWMHRETDGGAAVSHSSPEGLPPADEHRGERVAVGFTPISMGGDSATA